MFKVGKIYSLSDHKPSASISNLGDEYTKISQ